MASPRRSSRASKRRRPSRRRSGRRWGGDRSVAVTPRELAALAAAAPSVTVAVVGDLMLDETWTGDVHRVAPEAPVPLLSLSAMSRRAGGAGNVAENLAALGARAVVVGAVGEGEEGEWL